MSVVTLPAQFKPHSCQLTQSVNQRVSAAPFGGSEQAIDLLNDRWLLSCELPNQLNSEGAWREAFIGALRGQVNVVNLYHFARKAPRGTVRGTLTLNAAAAQGASSIVVAGAYQSAPELVTNGTFDTDVSGWSVSGSNIIGWNSGTQDATITINTTSKTAYQTIATVVGKVYSVTGGFRANTHAQVLMYAGAAVDGQELMRVGSATYAVPVSAPTTILGNFIATATTTYIGLYIGGVAVNSVIFDNISVKLAEPGTLLAGDMLGVGGLLLMVASDCTANGSGVVTVPITNRLRVAQSSGAAVTWNQPTAAFRLLSTNGVGYAPAIANATSFDFGEAI